MKSMSTLQYQLRHRMQDQGLSANALEKKANLKPSAVQNILQGKSKRPAALLLQAIAKELHCTTADLLGDTSTQLHPGPLSKGGQNEVWSPQLFVEAIKTIEELLAEKGVKASKEATINYADELYKYSLMKSSSAEHAKVDHHFASWLINR